MAANTGRTNAKHIQVFLDNSGGTLTEITACNTVGQPGLEYETADQTAYSDGVKNITIGHPSAPIQLGGPFDTVAHAHLIAINGGVTPLTFDVRIGIRHAWETGEPQFGITSASLDVFGATAPAWGTAAET